MGVLPVLHASSDDVRSMCRLTARDDGVTTEVRNTAALYLTVMGLNRCWPWKISEDIQQPDHGADDVDVDATMPE